MEILNDELEKEMDRYIDKFEEDFEIPVKDRIDNIMLTRLFQEYIQRKFKTK